MVSKAGTRLCDGCLYGGEYVGLAFATPVLFWVLTAFDWRAVFISSGCSELFSPFSGLKCITSRTGIGK